MSDPRRACLQVQCAAWVIGLAMSGGCRGVVNAPSGVGNTGGSGATGSTGTMAGGGGGAPAPAQSQCVQGGSFAPARLSLISDEQYRNVVRDVFGVTYPTTVELTTLPSTSGSYSFNENAQIEPTTVQKYQRAADEVAALMTSMPPCTLGAVNAACFEQYLSKALPLAWRRPVTDAEMSGLMGIFNSAALDGQARQVQLTMEAALIHPAFLYRTEIGGDAAPAAAKVRLTPYELASAVSFAVLDSSPDAELWTKAADGTLLQPQVLAAQVTRLMALATARANLMKKVSYYLDFEALPFAHKDAAAFPAFAPLQDALYQSSQLFLNDIIWGGHFSDLFTSRRIYANQAMAAAYGLPAVTGTQLQAVTASGDAYGAGVLTQPALLAASAKNAIGDDVVHRGLWIHDNLLCAPALPSPPDNAAAVAATITGSTREQTNTRDQTCGMACHGRFDPLGLVTLSYDGIGRYRTTDPTTTPPGGPIDTSATVAAGVLDGGDPRTPVTLAGVNDLAQRFVQGRQVSDCAAQTLVTYTLEHRLDVDGSCELQTVKNRFQQSGSFSDLFMSILTSPAFLTRDP